MISNLGTGMFCLAAAHWTILFQKKKKRKGRKEKKKGKEERKGRKEGRKKERKEKKERKKKEDGVSLGKLKL